jgi:hypothetical protein
LVAYGLSSHSVKLLENYLTGRKQQIKFQGVVSGWQILQKGVPSIKLILNHSIKIELSFSKTLIKVL